MPPEEGWQFPQGGRKEDSSLIDDLRRELCEEIGTDSIEVLQISPKTYFYDFPPEAEHKRRYVGQQQQWVLVRLKDEKGIHFDHEPREFDRYQWVTPEEALERIVPFKKEVYRNALRDLELLGNGSG